jgi:hypothetical protein
MKKMKSKKRVTKNEKIVKKKNTTIIHWLSTPEFHDYPAALSYLSIVFEEDKAKGLVALLKKAKVTTFKAKDIFRASCLPVLGNSNLQVRKNLKKISKGEKLSPILLVRDKLTNKVIIADGYHRMVACYEVSENILIPCKIV